MAHPEQDPPFEGGSQPVKERPTGIRGEGRGAMQIAVVAVAVLVVLAALLWFLVPILGSTD